MEKGGRMKTQRKGKGEVSRLVLSCISKEYKSIKEIAMETDTANSSVDKAIKKLIEEKKVDKNISSTEEGQSISKYKSLIIDDQFDPDYLKMLVDKYNKSLKDDTRLILPIIEKEMAYICSHNKVLDEAFITFVIGEAKKDPADNVIFLGMLNDISFKLEEDIEENKQVVKRKKLIDDSMEFFDSMVLNSTLNIKKRLEIYEVLSNINIKRTFPLTLELFRTLDAKKKFEGYKRNIHKKYSTDFHIFMNVLRDKVYKYYRIDTVDCKSKLLDILADPNLNELIRTELEDICRTTQGDPNQILDLEVTPEDNKFIENECRRRGISYSQFARELLHGAIETRKKITDN